MPAAAQPFDREAARRLAKRIGLADKLQDNDPGFHLTDDDLRMIGFALTFTADQL